MIVRTEMLKLIRTLDQRGIAYALCGGLAMAIHGWPRATMDIDILIDENRLPDVRSLARDQGFTHEPGEMVFSKGRVRMFRMVKFQGPEFIPLDILLATGDLTSVWQDRRTVGTDDGPISVVSAEGLIRMKSMRGSGTDKDDIRKLEGGGNGAC